MGAFRLQLSTAEASVSAGTTGSDSSCAFISCSMGLSGLDLIKRLQPQIHFNDPINVLDTYSLCRPVWSLILVQGKLIKSGKMRTMKKKQPSYLLSS